DVNDRGVGSAKFLQMIERLAVNVLGNCEPGSVSLRQPDDLLQPGGARGLDVQAGSGPLQGAADRRVNRKLIAPGVNAELERGRQFVLPDRIGDHRDIGVELLLELRKVA